MLHVSVLLVKPVVAHSSCGLTSGRVRSGTRIVHMSLKSFAREASSPRSVGGVADLLTAAAGALPAEPRGRELHRLSAFEIVLYSCLYRLQVFSSM